MTPLDYDPAIPGLSIKTLIITGYRPVFGDQAPT